MRLIDADALYEEMQWSIEHDMYDKPFDYLAEILDAPSIDIVRCGECKYNPKGIGWVSCPMTGANTRKPDDFCSYGERNADSNTFNTLDALNSSEKPNNSERSSDGRAEMDICRC